MDSTGRDRIRVVRIKQRDYALFYIHRALPYVGDCRPFGAIWKLDSVTLLLLADNFDLFVESSEAFMVRWE